MAPAAFINPAVIHRTAALGRGERGVALEPFRYREGVALGGSPLTLPLRLGRRRRARGHAGRASGRCHARGPAVRERVAGALRSALPSSGFGPAADRLEPWRWRFDVDARTAGSHRVGVRVDAEGHPGYLATARMLGEAGLMLADRRRDARARRLPDPGAGARHRRRSTASSGPGCRSRSTSRQSTRPRRPYERVMVVRKGIALALATVALAVLRAVRPRRPST